MKFYYNNLEEIRTQARMSIAELCRKLKISRMTYWNWTKGKNTPTESKVQDLAKFLQVQVDEISDLTPIKDKTEKELTENTGSWLLLGGIDEEKKLQEEMLFKFLYEKHTEELRQASVLVQALITSMDTPFYVKDTNNNYTLANQSFLDLVSFKGTSIKGMKDSDFFNKQEAEANKAEDLQVMQNAEKVIEKEYYLPNTRKKRWCMAYKHPIFDRKKKAAGVIGAFIDITRRKKEENLRRLLLDSLTEGGYVVFLRDLQTGKYAYVSDSVEEVYGYKRDVFKKDPLFWEDQCLHPDYTIIEKEYYRKRSWPSSYYYKIKTSSKAEKWIRCDTFTGRGYLLGLEKDISDSFNEVIRNKLIKNALNDSKVMLFAFNKDRWGILDEDSTPVLLKNKSSKYHFLFLNNGLETVTGYPMDKFTNEPSFWLDVCIHPDERKQEAEYFKNASWPSERNYRIITKGRDIRIINSKRYHGQQGYDLCVDTDITDLLEESSKNTIKKLIKNGVEPAIISESFDLSIDYIINLKD